jgi:hypothetical protein
MHASTRERCLGCSLGCSTDLENAEAAEWLADYLALTDGRAGSAQIKAAGRTAGHSYDSLKRARVKIGSLVESSGFPRRMYWLHPKESREQPSEQQ